MKKFRSLNEKSNCQAIKLNESELRNISGGQMGPGDKDGTGNQGGIWDWFKDLIK